MNLPAKIQYSRELKVIFLTLFVFAIVFLTSCNDEHLINFSQLTIPDYVVIGDQAFEEAFDWQPDAYLGGISMRLIEKRISYYFYSDEYPLQYLVLVASYDDIENINFTPFSGKLNLDSNLEYKINLGQLEINAEEVLAIAHPLAEEIYQRSGLQPNGILLVLEQEYRKSEQRILVWRETISFSNLANIHIILDATSGEVLEIRNSDHFNE